MGEGGWGNLIFVDHELVYIKDYIECVKPKLENKNRNYTDKTFEEIRKEDRIFPPITIKTIAIQRLWK